VVGALAGVALLALALFAILRYRRRRQIGPEVPPYEPEVQYHAPDPNAMAANGVIGIDTMASGDGMGIDKKFQQLEMMSEMEARRSPLELPEEPQRWHELESPPATI
jgi:hypothetical protein